jgi:signal transduction histidine kinase
MKEKVLTPKLTHAPQKLNTTTEITNWYREAIRQEGCLKHIPPSISKYIDEIYLNDETLALLRNLLSVSMIDQGQPKNSPKLVHVPDLVQDIVSKVKTLAKKHNVTVKLNLHKIKPIKIDPSRIHEVIENLIVNSIKYNVPQGKVEITLDQNNSELLATIKDTGIGISNTDQKKLFAKFFRTRKGALNNPEGSGLGLWVAKSYVDSWGGRISLQSQEGVGSTFSLALPFNLNN